MASDPVKAILGAQDRPGWRVKPGPGYATKYRGSAWQIIFCHQLGADAADERVRRGYEHAVPRGRLLGRSRGVRREDAERAPPPSTVVRCLNGDLLAALAGPARCTTSRHSSPPGTRGTHGLEPALRWVLEQQNA